MPKRKTEMTLRGWSSFADHVADRVVRACREERLRFWKKVGYLLMVFGAIAGLLKFLTSLVASWM